MTTKTTTTKADIADVVYNRLGGLSKRESAEIVEHIVAILKEALMAGDKVKLSGFGNFVVRHKNPRIGRNPLTGREIMISARHVVTFKPSPVLKERINGVDSGR